MRLIRALRFLAESLAVVLAGAVCAAVLIRTSPGSDIDVREANSQLSEVSVQALRAAREQRQSLFSYTIRYAFGVLRGDFGFSTSANRRVSELLRERMPVTAALVAEATVLALVIAFAFAAGVRILRFRFPAALVSGANTLLLTLPAGVVALLAVFTRTGILAALITLVASRIYIYADRLIADRLSTTYALSAESLGISRSRILLAHVLPSLGPEAAGLASLAVVTALNASLPMEVLCGHTGLGQLAWNAAMQRDIAVVVAVTLVMVLITRAGTALSRLLLPSTAIESV